MGRNLGIGWDCGTRTGHSRLRRRGACRSARSRSRRLWLAWIHGAAHNVLGDELSEEIEKRDEAGLEGVRGRHGRRPGGGRGRSGPAPRTPALWGILSGHRGSLPHNRGGGSRTGGEAADRHTKSMSPEAVDPDVPLEGRTLFQILDPWEVEAEVEQAEREVLQELGADDAFLRTGIEVIDYLVDQIRFFKVAGRHAERRGLRGLPALDWAAYLSWPETQRVAGTQWRRDLVRRYAFEMRAWHWQRALHAREPGDPVNVGPSREEIWYPPTLQLGPYPSAVHLTKMAPAVLEAHVDLDTRTTPGPLAPVRRLNQAMTWRLQVSAARLYNARFWPFDIIIDEPRDYSAEEARATLLARVGQLEWMLRRAESEPSTVPPAVVVQWRHEVDHLREAAEQIGQAKTRDRAGLLERCFVIPGTWWLGPVEILTDDLPPEWLGVMLAFAFDRRGLLSVRDGKRLRKVAATVFDHWQSTHYPDREISPKLTQLIGTRLGQVRRLLQPASLFAYVRRFVPPRRK